VPFDGNGHDLVRLRESSSRGKEVFDGLVSKDHIEARRDRRDCRIDVVV